MIERFNRYSLAWGIPGAALQLIAMAIFIAPDIGMSIALHPNFSGPTAVIGTLMLIAGLANYARAKGRHSGWCALALLGIPGIVILVVILATLEDVTTDSKLRTG